MENKNYIELKPVKDLLGMSFFIPNYQRGYRWTKRQVEDLLGDLKEFMDKGMEGNYCLQPLVVKRKAPEYQNIKDEIQKSLNSDLTDDSIIKLQSVLNSAKRWEVIDGQQRLTTVFLILKYLDDIKESPYLIAYETREGSTSFLNDINTKQEEDAVENIDFTYFFENYKCIKRWFDTNTNLDSNKFKDVLLNHTQFIWYESEENDPIEVFTRLNIGKISLTNSELVKALFLNTSNYGQYAEIAILRQKEIALQWDRIENSLQKDEFWCFFHEDGYDQPTRIDYILNIVRELHPQKDENGSKVNNLKEGFLKDRKRYFSNDEEGYDFWQTIDDHGTDYYQTFRFFDELFKRHGFNEKTLGVIWKEIKKIYDLFVEWYNDLEFYHYIGLLIAIENHKKYDGRDKIIDHIKKWFNVVTKKNNQKIKASEKISKQGFVDYLIEKVQQEIIDVKDLDLQYEIKEENKTPRPKTKCFPLLLLFNIQTIIDQNRQFKDDPKFNSSDFQRFPFNLFKKEKGWDIEHIAPNSENELGSDDDKKAWFNSAIFGVHKELGIPENYDDAIKEFGSFDCLKQKLEGNTLDEKERNKVWNFTLLDQSTNRSYGNSIFASKRKEILARDRGMKIEEGEEKALEKMVYLPPCTKNVFLKYYTKDASDLAEWTKDDALYYKKAIYITLHDLFKVQSAELNTESNEQ